MAVLNIDTTNIQPAAALDPIPAGWYNAHIVESDMKPTNNGQGAYLELELAVLDGAFAGRKIWDRLNLHNQNPQAVEIAYKTLSAISHAVNVIQIADSAQLHNLPLQVKVTLKPTGMGADGKMHDAGNEVKGYKAVGTGATPTTAPYAPPVPPAPPAAAAPAQPWAAPATAPAAVAPATPPWGASPAAATAPAAFVPPAGVNAPPPWAK